MFVQYNVVLIITYNHVVTKILHSHYSVRVASISTNVAYSLMVMIKTTTAK